MKERLSLTYSETEKGIIFANTMESSAFLLAMTKAEPSPNIGSKICTLRVTGENPQFQI
jgi:hypothetical protein